MIDPGVPADAEGRPQSSYKGGDPGFVRVLDERTIAFPNYDGNGMYLTAGNMLVNEFRSGTTAQYADSSWQHLSRSQYASIEKARTMLSYAPAFEPEAAVLDGIRWLIDHDRLKVANRLII